MDAAFISELVARNGIAIFLTYPSILADLAAVQSDEFADDFDKGSVYARLFVVMFDFEIAN